MTEYEIFQTFFSWGFQKTRNFISENKIHIPLAGAKIPCESKVGAWFDDGKESPIGYYSYYMFSKIKIKKRVTVKPYLEKESSELNKALQLQRTTLVLLQWQLKQRCINCHVPLPHLWQSRKHKTEPPSCLSERLRCQCTKDIPRLWEINMCWVKPMRYLGCSWGKT